MQGAESLAERRIHCGDAVILRDGTAIHATEWMTMDIEEIIGFDALYESMMKCKKGVLWKDGVAFYYHNWIRETLRLEKELHDGTYRERKPKFFTIHEPKTREIMSIAFRDRVYQRSLNDNAIYPQVTKSFIYDNHACQKGKGTHKARERMVCFLQRHYRKYGSEGYALKCDIHGYYPNMLHDVAKSILRQYLEDDIFRMAEEIIDNFPGEVGFNPGSQIIQIVGIAGLNKLDHIIKERLGISGYGRVMDDFIPIFPEREHLERCLLVIKEHLAGMHMELNQEKTHIRTLEEGFKYLGFYFRLTKTGKVIVTLDPKKVKNEKRKLRRMVGLVKKGLKKKERVDEHFNSWLVHASYGNSDKLVAHMKEFYQKLWEDAEYDGNAVQIQ